MPSRTAKRRAAPRDDDSKAAFRITSLIPYVALVFILAVGAYLVWERPEALSPEATLIAGRPPVEFDPAVFDFGEMPLQTTRSETVYVRNVGATPLSVRAARSSCGCLRADLAPVQIRPGSAVQMPLQMNSLSTPGTATFTVNVMFDGYEEPAVLTVRRTTLGGE